jgi:hypothetical protein
MGWRLSTKLSLRSCGLQLQVQQVEHPRPCIDDMEDLFYHWQRKQLSSLIINSLLQSGVDPADCSVQLAAY